jgi:hypothetical protein
MKHSLLRFGFHRALTASCAAVLCLTSMAADITGVYKIKYEGQDGDTRQGTIKLKHADGKLTGSVVSQTMGEAPIADGKVDGEKVTFKVNREREGTTFTVDYSAAVTGDSIKGKFSAKLGDNELAREFEGKREIASAGAAGTWKWSIDRNGTTINSVMKLTQDGEKISGTVTTNDREGRIAEGKFKDGELSFQVERERDGNKFVVKYKGKLDGDSILGKLSLTIEGEERTFDWNPKRVKE